VRAGAPVDVADDLTVSGATTYPIHGHFVLTPVSVVRPTYAQWLAAKFGNETTAPLASDQIAAWQSSRGAFSGAQRNAVSAAASVFSVDPARLEVVMRPLDLGGSSVALVYALTLADMLDPADVARGRTIAATGELDAEGRVRPVRFVAEKVRVARAAGATVFLVPPGQTPRVATSMRIIEVASLAEALAVLRTS
jgi:PDZ domain-containing secreted protein